MGLEMNGNGIGSEQDNGDPNHVKLTEAQLVRSEFGLPLEDCYKVAVKYYKDHEKSGEITVPYDDRVKLMAYSKQVRNGPYSDGSEGAGWFDFVGNDVIRVWRELGSQSKEDAMAAFVFLVDRVCPPFKNFISDQILPPPNTKENGETSELRNLDGNSASGQVDQQTAASWEIYDAQRQHIQQALNAQTFHHAYAQRQFPGQPEQQAALIRQLQEQHYTQYMSQVYQQQAAAADPNGGKKVKSEEDDRARDEDSDLSDEEAGEDLPSNPAIAPASLWNRQDIAQFKNNIKKEGSEGILKIGHGETVTIRVPTHEDGTCLFWEFATDYYDIGFGVYFEWTIADSNQVSIHVSESDDEDELDEAEEAKEGEGAKEPVAGDVETGAQHRRVDPNKPRQDEIIPVYRRDCHEEVYAGSHVYPGRGVYLLKFDNSYSLWRSKTLYYRVYYSK